MERSNPFCDIDQIWLMVDIIIYAKFGDYRLRGASLVNGLNLPSPIDLRCRPYNTGLCDRVMQYNYVYMYVKINSALFAIG